MLGKMKDYQIKTIFKFIAKKEGFGLAESTAVQKEEQQGTVLEALKNGGNVFGIYKKKELQACYVFERAKVMENEIPYPKYDLNKENAWDFITGHDVQEPEAPVEESEEETGFFGELKEDLDEMIDSVADTDEEEDDQKNKEVTVLRLKEVYNHTVPAEVLEEFEKNGLSEKVWQYFIAVPDIKSVGVKDESRYEGWPAIIRAVNTKDAMSATIEEIPYPILHHITHRITHEVPGINRVLLDLTPKPIGTIEWE